MNLVKETKIQNNLKLMDTNKKYVIYGYNKDFYYGYFVRIDEGKELKAIFDEYYMYAMNFNTKEAAEAVINDFSLSFCIVLPVFYEIDAITSYKKN